MESHAVHCHKSVEKFLARHGDLLERWPRIKATLEENPYPRGTQVVTHLKLQWHCSYKYKAPPYRFLFDIYPEKRVVYIFEVNGRGQVYR